MEPLRLTLRELTAADGELSPATVQFQAGLNLIVGASDTGKTFILEAIDFMLGGNPENGLRRIPAGSGYNRLTLAIDSNNQSPFTLRRAFSGGDFEVAEFANGRNNAPSLVKTLSSVHSPDPDVSLSSYLLRCIGLEGREIRRSAKGEKRSLSFRYVCGFCIVDEESIIQQASPVLSGQYTEKTTEQNIFAFFLTGQDDSAVIVAESAKQKKARLAAEEDILESLISNTKAELGRLLPDTSEIAAQASRLDDSINRATQSVVASQEGIERLEKARRAFLEERTSTRSRLLFVQEQLKRLRLLDAYYRSDRDRLSAVIEASHAFHDLPEGTCPLCRQPLPNDEKKLTSHESFEQACHTEIRKIDALKNDLEKVLGDFANEEAALSDRATQVLGELQQLNTDLQTLLAPATRTAQTELHNLVQARTSIARAESLDSSLHLLQQQLEQVQEAKKAKVPRQSFEKRATTSVASEFCKVVESILKAWKYPELGTVSFDTEKGDLVIGGQDRATKGKGYRGLTYAAFTIGLMKYCRAKSIPHPGFVILDTPINNFKGPAATSPTETLPDEIKAAFFEYLVNDKSGDQFIVLENVEPQVSIQHQSNYVFFTKNARSGRYGFFPHRPATKEDFPEA